MVKIMTSRLAALSATIALAGAFSASWGNSPDKLAGGIINRLSQQYLDARTAGFDKKAAPKTFSLAEDAELILSQDFSEFTSGSETELGTYVTEAYETAGDPYIDGDRYPSMKGWWGIGVYEAGGECALARSDNGGTICTNEMNLYGNITVKLRAKNLPGEPGPLVIFCNICYGGAYYPRAAASEYSVIPIDDEWHEYIFILPNSYSGDDAYLQLNAMCYSEVGTVIDDVKVYRDYHFATSPSNVVFRNFVDDSFVASWQPGAENKSYLVDVMEEKMVSDWEELFSEDFEYADIIDEYDHNFAGDPVRVGAGADGSNALVFTANSDWFTVPTSYAPVNNLSFFIKGKTDPEYSEAALIVALSDGFNEVESLLVDLNNVPEEGTVVDFAEMVEGFSGIFKGVRLYPDGLAPGEEIYVDNIECETQGFYKRVFLKEKAETDVPEITVSGIKDTGDYYVRVYGVNGDIVTEPTLYAKVFGVRAPKLLSPTEIEKRGAYTANWEAEPLADSYTVYNYITSVLPEAEENRVMLRETFPGAHADNGEHIALESGSLDGIAGADGWRIVGGKNYMSDNAIECQRFAILISPVLSLQGDGGRFNVKFHGCARGVDQIVVECGNEAKTYTFNGKWNNDNWNYDRDEADISFDFTSGTAQSEIKFYTPQNSFFKISDITVTQNTDAGQMMYTLESSQEVEASETSTRFKGLKASADHNYAYTVVSHRYDPLTGRTAVSRMPEAMDVYLDSTAVERLESCSGEDRIFVSGSDVVVEASGCVMVFNASGTCIRSADSDGMAVFSGLLPGIYLVKTDSTVKKIIL